MSTSKAQEVALTRAELEEMLASIQRQAETTAEALAQLNGRPAGNVSVSELSKRIPVFAVTSLSAEDVSFSDWYKRYEHMFVSEGEQLSEKTRVQLLVDKLDQTAYKRLISHVLPKEPIEFKLAELVATLKQIFDVTVSKFTKQYHCWTSELDKTSLEEVQLYSDRINEKFEQVEKLDIDGLKVLRFLIGLKGREDAEHLPFLLSFCDRKTETGGKVTLQEVTIELKKLQTYKKDSQMVTRANGVSQSSVNAVHGSSREAVCYNCAKKGHFSMDCKAAKVTCHSCQQIGHRKQFCRAKAKQFHSAKQYGQGGSQKRKPAYVKSVSIDSGISRSNTSPDAKVNAVRRYMDVVVNGVSLQFQVDTGADVTLINEESWKKLGLPTVIPAGRQLKTANMTELEVKGQIPCSFNICGENGHGDAYVVRGSNLLGLDWLEKSSKVRQGLDQIGYVMQVSEESLDARRSIGEQLEERFPQIFESGLGLCTKETARLTLKADVKPRFCSARPVPYAAKEAVEKEITRLLEMGVIEPVNHSAWAAPIVCVSKKATDKIRVCADFSTGLNAALEDHEHPLPVPDDIFALLNGGTVFSQVDFSDAYLQVMLDDSAKELVVINTHKGLYRYSRLPFGIKTAPAIFQSIVTKMCTGLQGVACYLDDILVKGDNRDEHDRNLLALFERIAEYGFRVQIQKCSFHQEEIQFLGYIVDRQGRRPDPAKIKALVEMKRPEDVNQLRSFLGMLSYYGNFIPNIKNLRGILDELTHKDVKWDWTDQRQKAFEELLAVLASDLNLCHYDPKLPILVAADACEYGVGGVISHRFPDGTEKPVHHFAKALTAAEKNYSQIEKEALGLVTAVKKFHKYLFGRKFLLKTDHKPLLAIYGSKKGLPAHSVNRLIRWGMILLGYDFTMEYTKTEDFGQADALSRLMKRVPMENEDVVIAQIENDIDAVFQENIRRLPLTAKDIEKELAEDPLLRQVKSRVEKNSWPANTKKLEEGLKTFYERRTELTVVNNCLMKGDRVVVPARLCLRVLRELHRGHPGIVRMKQLARTIVYWPGIDSDIERFVRGCADCQLAAKTDPKVPLQPWPNPESVWGRIHIDYAGPLEGGAYYLVVVDSLSKWPEVFITKTISAAATVSILKSLFSRTGNPEVIVSDNGTQFTASEFQEMCAQRGIKHIRTAPYHPQSNGRAERFVDTLKRGLRKLKGEERGVPEEVLQTLLMSYRSTPSPSLEGQTPAEVFLGRKLRTVLSLLKPSSPQLPEEKDILMKKQFDEKHGVKPRSYQTGDPVWFKKHRVNHWNWIAGTVVNVKGKTNYIVETEQKQLFHVHANQMRSSVEDKDSGFTWYNTMMHTFNLLPNGSSLDAEAPRSLEQTDTGEPDTTPGPDPTVLLQRRYPTRTRKPPTRYEAVITSWRGPPLTASTPNLT